MLALTGPAAGGAAVDPALSSFFSDPYFNDVTPGAQAWPYIGGWGDHLADLGAWKYLTGQIPEEMSPPERIEALRQAALLALGADADGADFLLKARLFLELTSELQAYGAYMVRVDARTCLPPDDSPPERPAAPPGWRLGWRETLERERLLQLLCDAANAQSREIVLGATRDLETRWRALDLRTEGLERGGDDLRSRQEGMSQADLISIARELKDPPDSAMALAWVEEFDTLLGMGALRHTLRPDWASLASLVAPESGSATSSVDSIAFCGAWIGPAGVSLDPGRFLDAHLEVSAAAVRIVPGSPIPFGDPAMLTAPEVIASRIAVALYAAAWRSAGVESKELLRGTTDPKWRAPDREGNRPPGPLTCWAGNPLDLRTLLVRRVDQPALLAEFGVGFGLPLSRFREELRDRVLHFDSPGRTTEQLLYALTRLGIAPFLERPSSPEMETATFPWLGEEPLARLRSGWPARMRAARAAQVHDFVHEALAGFATVRQMPAPVFRQLRLRTAESLAACIEPYLTQAEIVEDRALLANARRNLNDTLHDTLRATLVAACDEESAKAPKGKPATDRAAIRVDLLSRRAGTLASRVLPGSTPATAADRVEEFGLDHPCADPDAALLRFGALYDVMTAVFALEAYLAGESFDAPFDRAAARRVGHGPFAAVDEWLTAERIRIGTVEAKLESRRPPKGSSDEAPGDCLPPLVVRPESLAIRPPNPKEIASRLGAWAESFALLVSGRAYPDDLAETGWRAWDDYIEEEARHRRIDLESRENGFELRVVFAPTLRYRDLVAPDGTIAPAAEMIVWSRLPGDGAEIPDRYVIEQVRSGRTEQRVEIPIPTHPRAPGPRTRAAALAWAMVHLR